MSLFNLFQKSSTPSFILISKIYLLISAGWAIPTQTHAQYHTLPTITTSSGTYYDWIGYGSAEFGRSIASGAQPFPGYAALVWAANQYAMTSDVRCTSNSKDITSRDHVASRWAGAEAVFRNMMRHTPLFDRIFGNTPFKNGILTVIYADDGKEQWPVIEPYFSAALGGMPIPGTLEERDGIAKPHPVCNKNRS